MEVSGHQIPEGITVGCHARVIHLDKSVYGEDAVVFRPERWLEAGQDQQKLMERCGIWFGAGKRICLGQHLARAKIMEILAMLLMKFEISDNDPGAIMVSGVMLYDTQHIHTIYMQSSGSVGINGIWTTAVNGFGK
ncbi:Cytochrome P450 [Penicillium taxi]|uniref:Cytochrome P450 n=1 Tax=Penicillium taxi TaxID=168475 RepID=UPI0025458407|nr:Cytochrome P450 [Penicillium taxi]KAJ5899606.1 Cytochrome P450 [Penicillium taxi]